ncbi:MAG: DUF3795 domain-containing protein [Syntrophobacterales bacterium]|nr:MAG: DUF3795 domain-containing protein [Syntrophobacterales bacterium]
MTDNDLTGYCGLYCGDCIRYRSRASELAADLLKEFENTQFAEYAKVKQSQIPDFQHYKGMVSLLAHISRLRCNVPCRLGGDGCMVSCPIMECVKGKAFEGCWECSEYKACQKLTFLKSFHGDTPLDNLDKIKEFGLRTWAKHRGNCYPWLKQKIT